MTAEVSKDRRRILEETEGNGSFELVERQSSRSLLFQSANHNIPCIWMQIQDKSIHSAKAKLFTNKLFYLKYVTTIIAS